MGIFSLLRVCHFVFLVLFFVLFCLFFLFFFCTVTDFSAAEKDRGVKFRTRVGLLSGQVFSNFEGQRSKSPGTQKRLRVNGMPSLQAACSSSVHQQRTRAFPGGQGVTACSDAR